MKEFLATVELSQKKEFEEEWRRKFDALPKSLQEPLIKALIRRTINENGKGIVNLDDQTYQMYREIAEGDLKCLFTFQKDGEDLIEVINPELSLTIESVLANL